MGLIKVKLPSGELQKVKVPDDWDESQIASAMEKHFPEDVSEKNSTTDQSSELTGLTGVGADILSGALNAGKFVGDVPNKLEKYNKYKEENPVESFFHDTGQLAAEGADIGKGVINSAYNLNQYLARKHLLPQVLGKMGKLIPHIPEDLGIEKALGLEADPSKGDDLIRAVPDVLGAIEGVSGVGKGVKKITTAPSKEKLFQRALEDRIDKAADKTAMSEGQLKDLKNALKLDYSKIHGKTLGEASPVSLQEGINVAESQLAEKKPFTEILQRDIGEIPEAPDTKAIVDKQKAALKSATEEAEKVVGIKSNPRLEGSKPVKKAIMDVKESASNLYKTGRQRFIDEKISAENTDEIKSVTKDLEALRDADELAPGYGSGTAEQKSLQSQIETLKGETVNASDIFDLQRTLEKMAEDTRKKQYSGVNDIEFKRLNGIAERLDSHADSLAKRLETVGGKDVQSMFKEANKGWKTYKNLSLRNPVGKASLKGEIPMRTMIEIAKDHPGNDFLQALVESNPELKKNVLAAYTGETNINKLLNPTSLVKKYIQDLPEVEEHVNALKSALKGVKEGEVKASKVKKEYDNLVKTMGDEAKEQKVRQDAVKESDALERQIKFKKDAIPKIESKMKEVEINSSEHKKLEKELAENKKFISDKGGRLKELAKLFLKVKLIGKVHI